MSAIQPSGATSSAYEQLGARPKATVTMSPANPRTDRPESFIQTAVNTDTRENPFVTRATATVHGLANPPAPPRTGSTMQTGSLVDVLGRPHTNAVPATSAELTRT